jgi:hypothetical protein
MKKRTITILNLAVILLLLLLFAASCAPAFEAESVKHVNTRGNVPAFRR